MSDALLALLWMFGPAALILSLGSVLDWCQRRQDRAYRATARAGLAAGSPEGEGVMGSYTGRHLLAALFFGFGLGMFVCILIRALA